MGECDFFLALITLLPELPNNDMYNIIKKISGMPDYAYLLMTGGLLAAHILFSFLSIY